ncbi:TPA: hypothetical protein NO313_004875 [Pseudomonas aeruginosa]|uniref:hypothetical protein n=1 Tax=Pseudomonas aeruginosa TaxID=287 RepID=UPI001A7E2D39|nr:hypothetical protein [Pseudomonas aeruginosa]WOT67841.1 hypothetical protein R5030_26750 [Pseudomonas aeruginosa]WOT92858.1 hypothetical protein R5023_22805 [Pseudomonas aeruginosa]HBP5463325.1 hypothetical protein [Pseudomonas aeruginosa]HBP5786664.1 hypothetical protein [Pseudomonas aeruginosa]HBP5834285.1 hypothetical protein [Pseudomonas aeruginosa]
MSTSAHASNSSASSRFASASAAKNVGLFRTDFQLPAIAAEVSPDSTQIPSSSSITKLCASTFACNCFSSSRMSSALLVNVTDFIVHGAMPLPSCKYRICLEGPRYRASGGFQ